MRRIRALQLVAIEENEENTLFYISIPSPLKKWTLCHSDIDPVPPLPPPLRNAFVTSLDFVEIYYFP